MMMVIDSSVEEECKPRNDGRQGCGENVHWRNHSGRTLKKEKGKQKLWIELWVRGAVIHSMHSQYFTKMKDGTEAGTRKFRLVENGKTVVAGVINSLYSRCLLNTGSGRHRGLARCLHLLYPQLFEIHLEIISVEQSSKEREAIDTPN